MLGVGIWAAVNAQSFMNVVATNVIIFDAVYVIIAVGAALVVISFLGCCGAIKENKCLLGTVSIFTFLSNSCLDLMFRL